MKIRLTLFALLVFSLSTVAQQTDSVQIMQQERIDALERTAQTMQQTMHSQQQVISSMQQDISALRSQIALTDSQVVNVQDNLKQKTSLLAAQDVTLQTQIEQNYYATNSTKFRLLWAIIIGALLLLVVLCVTIILYRHTHKREKTSIDKIREAQQALQEDSLKLDDKLVELLDKQLVALQATNQKQEPDHSLALKIADEIVRIETNLSRMDSSIKGYKQLSASVRRIKDNFIANGYELVEMLGKPYNEGMRVIVITIVPDESLPEGTSIISNIVKPQVNYNGVMIQAAQVKLSQN